MLIIIWNLISFCDLINFNKFANFYDLTDYYNFINLYGFVVFYKVIIFVSKSQSYKIFKFFYVIIFKERTWRTEGISVFFYFKNRLGEYIEI